MDHPTNDAEFQLSAHSIFNELPFPDDVVKKILTSEVCLLHFPDDKSGKLMTLQNGELAGKKTTSLVDGTGITGTAGLESLDLTPLVTQTFKSLWHVSRFVPLINLLATRIGRLERYQREKSRAELENVFIGLRDLARHVPEFAVDPDLKGFGLTQLAQVKKSAGEYFQMQLTEFEDHVHAMIDRVRSNGIYNISLQLEQLATHAVFRAFEIVALVALFQVVIDRRFTPVMLSAARDYLQDHSNQILERIDLFHGFSTDALTADRDQRRNALLSYHSHQSAEERYERDRTEAIQSYGRIVDKLKPLEKLLRGGTTSASVETLRLHVENELLVILDLDEGTRAPLIR